MISNSLPSEEATRPRGARRRRAIISGTMASLLFVAGLAETTHAATITVDTNADGLDVDGTCSLREAIQAANTDTAVDACAAGSGADIVVLPAGAFVLGVLGAGEDGNATGDLDVTGDLIIMGAGAANTIVDGAGIDRIFHIDPSGAGITVKIVGVTVKNGLAVPVGLASFGGGILNRGALTIESCTVRGNNGSNLDVFGGGIYNQGTLTLNDSTVSENGSLSQGVVGAGILNDSGGTLTIHRSTINDKVTGSGGGGITNRGTLAIENSTISHNTAFGPGGIDTGTGTITSSTLTGNQGVFGGALCCGPFLVLRNSIVAGNVSNGYGGDCLGGVVSAGHNLGGDGSCAFTAPGDVDGVDPHLGILADNGGPTRTHELLNGSPAIDAGDPVDCPATDQREIPRPQGAACDIGSFEVEDGSSECAPDTTPPTGSIVSPTTGSCHGPQELPVVVQDNFIDACDASLSRSYEPGPGPTYESHGDYDVVLTVSDDANNPAITSVTFSIDTVPPTVTLLAPVGAHASLPESLPLSVVFQSSDDDGAAGDVVHETISLQGCVVYDGTTFGNRDGLLRDETITLSREELCRIAAVCGFSELAEPELRVAATDCGGNVAAASVQIHGGVALGPWDCAGGFAPRAKDPVRVKKDAHVGSAKLRGRRRL